MEKIPPQEQPGVSGEGAAAQNAEDRRRYRRYDAAVDVRFRECSPLHMEEPLHLGQTLNICHAGMFIKTNCFYRIGTELELHVDVLTTGDSFRELVMTGRVMWISFEDSLPGMGVEFKDLDEENRRALLAHTYRGDLQFRGPDSTDNS